MIVLYVINKESGAGFSNMRKVLYLYDTVLTPYLIKNKNATKIKLQ